MYKVIDIERKKINGHDVKAFTALKKNDSGKYEPCGSFVAPADIEDSFLTNIIEPLKYDFEIYLNNALEGFFAYLEYHYQGNTIEVPSYMIHREKQERQEENPALNPDFNI